MKNPSRDVISALSDRKAAAEELGTHTFAEILSQPAIWEQTARQLGQQESFAALPQHFSSRDPWLFIGCGSSYYLCQLVSALWTKYFQISCTVVPASEFLFDAEDILRRTGAKQVVMVSRSGETSEVLRAGTILKRRNDIRTLAVTCKPSGALDTLSEYTLKLPWVDEKSMVMTRSFTSILLTFQRLGAHLKGELAAASELDVLPDKARGWLAANADKMRSFAGKRNFKDFVFLGQGSHYWLAQEAALKIMEMSSSYAQAYHTLEFRHGPRTIADPDTLITFLISDGAEEEETLLVQELKELGAVTLVIANRTTRALQESSDLLLTLDMPGPEFARFALAAIPAHLLGANVALSKGLNPDTPTNLTRAVLLDADGGGRVKRTTT